MELPPREKALDLVNKMNCQWQDPESGVVIPDHEKSIENALVAVKELIDELNTIQFDVYEWIEYWQAVKKILEDPEFKN